MMIDKALWKNFIGKKIKKDIMDENGVMLIPSDTVFKKEHIEKFINRQIILYEDDFYVNDDFLVDNSQEFAIIPMINDVIEEAKKILNVIKTEDKIPMMEIRNKILPNLQGISNGQDIFKLINCLHSQDDYTFTHVIGVSVLSNLIGKWMGFNEKDLSLLTLCSMIYDVGKLKIPEEILNKPGKLTQREFEIMKNHTIHGYEMIKKTVGTSHKMALVALQHHERMDGSGYPFGLKGDDIDLFSKIIGIADVFHAMTCKKVYSNANSFHKIIQEMNQGSFGKFDPHIIMVFMKNIMSTMIGNEVILTNGQKGKILMVNPFNTLKPMIQLKNGQIIDLSKDKSLDIDIIL